MADFDLPTRRPSVSSSIAGEIIVEARTVLSVLPTGEWRRSLRRRLSDLEGAVEAWSTSEPTTDMQKQVTAAALDLFSEIGEVK